MYGQGNYAPPFGQGPHAPTPSFQQRPLAPPPPPFQQGPPAPQPSTIQQGPPSIPPNVGQLAPPAYQNAPPAPLQQGPSAQGLPSAMLNAGQSYLPPPPPLPSHIHGSTSMAHSYPASHQNTPWTHNVHHMPPVAPLGRPPGGPSHPEMFQPPPPPRVLPPFLSQGHTMYRGQVPPPQPGGVQATQHIPPPPLPPTSSFFTPASFETFVHSAHQDSYMPASGPPPPPPPPPSSPPPPPPSPPPPSSPRPCSGTLSSTPSLIAFDLPYHSEYRPSSSEHSGFEVKASNSFDKLLDSHQTRGSPTCDGNRDPEGRSSSEVSLLVDDGLSSVVSAKWDLPPPPSKPAEEKIVQRIEDLCQSIAKNGPGFEDMVRQKEVGNPEFEFLYGGEPGSRAAVAYEYFVWMKRGSSLACKSLEEHDKSDSALRLSEIGTSMQPDSLMDAGLSQSPSFSDMDVEDDITQLDEERQGYNSVKGVNLNSDSIPTELDMKVQLYAVPAANNASEHIPSKDAIDDNFPCGSPRISEGYIPFPNHDHSSSARFLSKADTTVKNLSGAVECNLNNNVDNSSITSQPDLGQSNASASAADIRSDKFPGELIEGTSPFRLLQDYASDESAENNDEPRLQDVSPVTASPSTTDVGTSLDGDMVSNFQTDIGSKNLSTSEVGFGTFSESVVACSLSMPSKALEFSLESRRTSKESDITSIAIGRTEGHDNYRNQESVHNAASQEAFQGKDALGCVDAAAKSGKYRKEDVKHTPTPLKVDEFGRLVREGVSDSDSDDSHYKGRRVKRGKSRSRSRSPHDARRRRSSWRRKEKRSQSRSWSPKKRRSRSRSPTLRRGVDFGGDRMRRDNKGQIPACFDFLRGRCYRGASCRYLHSYSDKSDGSRNYRSKHQHVDVPPSSRSLDLHEEIENIPFKKSVHEQDAIKSQETQPFQDIPEDIFGALKEGGSDGKEDTISVRNAVQPVITDRESISLVTDVAESERSTTQVQETQGIKEELVEPTINLPDSVAGPKGVEVLQPIDRIPDCSVAEVNAPKSPGDTSHGIPSTDSLSVPKSQANLSTQVLQNVDHQPQQSSSASDLSPIQTSTSFLNQLPSSGPLTDKISSIQSFPGTGSTNQPYSSEGFSSQSLPPKEITSPIFPTAGFPHYYSQLPPPLPSLSQGTNMPPAPQLSGDYNLMPLAAKFPPHSASVEKFSPYQGPMSNQHSHFSVAPNASWTSLPPPPPRPPYINESTLNATTGMTNVTSLNFQPNQLPPRNDFSLQTVMRPYPTEVPAYSQVVDYPHRIHSPRQEPNRPPFHMENIRPTTLPAGNPMSQPFGGPNHVGEDRFTRLPVQGLVSSNPSTQGNMATQHVPFFREPAGRRMQSFPGDNLRPGELFMSPSDNPYLQQQQPLYSLQCPAADSVSGHPDEPGKSDSTMSRHTSDILDRNHPSHLSNFGGSRISNYYNPYASTFDQPLSSKFSSNIFKHEKDIPHSFKHDTSFSLSHDPVDGQGIGSLSSRHTTSSPNPARAVEHVLPRLGGEQYDPLFDSIEPSSNSFRKFDHGKKREPTNDSDVMLRLSGTYKPLDVEENNKQKDVVAVTTSLENDNDEFGETADAEVGAVENGSPSTPLDVMNTAAGEIEIDQIKTPGKSRKGKDSRSMKLFKGALADFVKEVLKPSWRQGNMSKEAFKTIVKKTVDKVAGAMKSHQIPKSQAKINHYIDSSQRKLTKLVMGYVDKYVKV
ncbi:uncharacterized protein LOC132284211 [Cornus florida]|uniref:uncharacterized protein LOC132284211 n=1 Tax=Cornus florida TaxID=4283 RepID=UPI00289F1340|nr:uncharacterized protein LOC132284211 [Cornus florida]